MAILAGWETTETGRQPWIVYGLLRTADAASPVSAAAVATSLALFVVVYCAVFSMGIWYIHRLIDKGPSPGTLAAPPLPEALPNRPLSLGARAQADEGREPPA